MKRESSIIYLFFKITFVVMLASINIGCVDSLNDPYPGAMLNEKPGIGPGDMIESPTDLNLGKFGEGDIYGLWWNDNSDNEDGFEVWRKEDASENYELLEILPPNSTAYNDSLIAENLTYYYKIRAYKDIYYSDFSNEVNTSQILGLIAPSELSGEKIPSSTNILLNWNDNSSNELGFVIERKLINEFEFIEVKRVGPNSATWTDTSNKLQSGLTANYRVKAYNSNEQSNYSNIFSITL